MKRSIVLLLCAIAGFTATAQTDNKVRLIDECQRLYSNGDYSAALSILERMDIGELDSKEKQEFDLLKALTVFENNVVEGRAMMLQYLSDYPETAKRKLLYCYIAESYYHTGKYDQACRWFGLCDTKRLSPKQCDEAKLHYSLSLLNNGDEGAAENLLVNLKSSSKEFGNDATFYLAIIKYNSKDLNKAYEQFKELEFDDKYHLEVPYYLAGIYLKRGDAARAKSIAIRFIEDHGTKTVGYKMHQILGAAEFFLGNYEEAAKALTIYVENYHTPQRIALYQLGASHYATGEYEKAMKSLLPCIELNDAIAQSALLHIGLIHIHNGNGKSARLTLEQAATMTYDDQVREEALYNYALCIHQTRYSPFAESVKTFEQFLNDYPTSQHANKVAEYLVEVYDNTRNYDVALQSINKIKEPSDRILEAKQNILYRLGVQEFINGNMDGAIEYMDSSLQLAHCNATTKSNALFWKGEALFRKGKIDDARSSYKQSLEASSAANSLAMYGIGYTHFKQKRYKDALKEFERYVKAADANDKETLADAYNRIADCHFYQRNFNTAEKYYTKATETYSKGADYSLFRFAQIQSLKNKPSESIKTLNKLISKHPHSPHTEQAMYEMGRNYIKQEKYKDAIGTYDKLIASFPKSATARRAMAERAMIYNSMGDRKNAIVAYKEIVSKHPHSDEARVALQDLKSIYIEMGRVDLYTDFVAKTKGAKPIENSEIDTLTYIAAEKAYGRGELDAAKKAFKKYLQDHPNGAFRLNSHYYQGVICYSQGAKDEALENLAKVLEYPNNRYSEEAMVVSADIYYDKRELDKAGELYRQIAAQSSNEERQKVAITRTLNIVIEQENHEAIIEYATMIEEHHGISPELKREAALHRAKAHLGLGNRDGALEELDLLAEDTRTKEGAEAKYLVAQMMFEDESYDFCEDEINEFIEMSTPHAYWMARSFILLADLYAAQDKTLEAKQYLLSLQNNYEGDDDIADIITERLEKLSNENEQE